MLRCARLAVSDGLVTHSLTLCRTTSPFDSIGAAQGTHRIARIANAVQPVAAAVQLQKVNRLLMRKTTGALRLRLQWSDGKLCALSQL